MEVAYISLGNTTWMSSKKREGQKAAISRICRSDALRSDALEGHVYVMMFPCHSQ